MEYLEYLKSEKIKFEIQTGFDNTKTVLIYDGLNGNIDLDDDISITHNTIFLNEGYVDINNSCDINSELIFHNTGSVAIKYVKHINKKIKVFNGFDFHANEVTKLPIGSILNNNGCIYIANVKSLYGLYINNNGHDIIKRGEIKND